MVSDLTLSTSDGITIKERVNSGLSDENKNSNYVTDGVRVLPGVHGGYQLCSGTTGTYARTVGPTDDKAGFG